MENKELGAPKMDRFTLLKPDALRNLLETGLSAHIQSIM